MDKITIAFDVNGTLDTFPALLIALELFAENGHNVIIWSRNLDMAKAFFRENQLHEYKNIKFMRKIEKDEDSIYKVDYAIDDDNSEIRNLKAKNVLLVQNLNINDFLKKFDIEL